MNRTQRLMDEMRARWAERGGQPPRGWRMSLPSWAWREFWAWPTLSSAWRLWRVGRIEWGWLLMANTALFEPGDDTAPGEVLWSPDPRIQADPQLLDRVGRMFWAVKKRTFFDGEKMELVPGIDGLWSAARDEYSRQHRKALSPLIAGPRLVYVESVLFPRAHLPGGVLHGKLMPIVVDPRARVRPVMMLPGDLWPDELRADWDDD